MSSQALSEYAQALLTRYDKSGSRKEKSRILDEICATAGIHRKHALRLLRQARTGGGQRSPRAKKRGPKSKYDAPALKKCMRTIWKAANLPCAKRLVVMIPDGLDSYERHYEPLSPELREKALEISASSLDRLLKRDRGRLPNHGRSTPKPGTLLRDKIPVATHQWEENRLGFVEADTVAHCGDTTSGTYVNSLVCVDMASTWVETQAVWGNKTDLETLKQLRSTERSLPFSLRGFDSDNGTEFLNQRLFQYLVARHRPVVMTRSRPYKKNDNAHVEQKNWTHVRQWIGLGPRPRSKSPSSANPRGDLRYRCAVPQKHSSQIEVVTALPSMATMPTGKPRERRVLERRADCTTRCRASRSSTQSKRHRISRRVVSGIRPRIPKRRRVPLARRAVRDSVSLRLLQPLNMPSTTPCSRVDKDGRDALLQRLPSEEPQGASHLSPARRPRGPRNNPRSPSGTNARASPEDRGQGARTKHLMSNLPHPAYFTHCDRRFHSS